MSDFIARTIGHYQILSPLGKGGMGEVYLAEDARLERRVALKVLPASFTQDADRVRRFMQEAKASSALNHPNIVTVYDIGESEAGRFIVMELVVGRTLRQVILEDNSVATLLALGQQMAKALAAAHAAGITHRDIKPDNLMVRDDGYVKVLDFGIARLHDTTDAHQTAPGLMMGTAAYMSPEQAQGGQAQPPSDVFALGLVLYELLTRRHPFPAQSSVGYLQAIALQPPIPLTTWRPEVPTALNALLMRMLHKNPAQRPPAAEVAQALWALERGYVGKIGGAGEGEKGRRGEGEKAGDVTAPISAPISLAGLVLGSRRNTVGREAERNELRGAFHNAERGRGALLCVAGEPGIGKTTLVEDFLAELQAGEPCTIVRGRCSERLAGTEAYLPLLEALESLLQVSTASLEVESSLTQALKQFAPTWYAQIMPLSGDNEESARLLAEVKSASQERMKRELANFLQAIAQRRPLVIFIDDLHWADVSTVDLLNFLAGKFDTMRVLIVTTYRPSDMLLAKHPFLQLKPDLQARGYCRELLLEFLTLGEIAEYLTLEFPGHQFPREFPALIHAKTEGSPLFMADLVRYLRDHGVLAQTTGAWKLERALPDIERELPESVRGMIERKIVQLSEEDRQLLTVASVQGYEFDSAVVAQVLNLEPDEVEERLEKLERVFAFVKLLEEGELPNHTLTLKYRFVHVLYQNALYGALRATRRASLSGAVAQSLLAFYGEKRDSIAAELAKLFEAARDWARASEYFLLAARQTLKVFATHEAAVLSEHGLQALQFLPETDERAKQELRLQMTLGPALMPTKGYGAPEVVRAFSRAAVLGRQLKDYRQLFQAQFNLAIALVVQAEYERAREQSLQILQLAEELANAVMRMQAHWILALSEGYLGRFVVAREHYEKAIVIHDAEGKHSPAALYGGTIGRAHLARLLFFLGHIELAKQTLADAIAQAERAGHPIGLVNTTRIVAQIEILHRNVLSVAEQAQQLSSYAKEFGMPYYAASETIIRGWAMTLGGASEEGIALLHEGLTAMLATGAHQQYAYFLGLLADALGHAGQTREGLAVLETALEEAARHQEHFYEAEFYRLKGDLLLADGHAPSVAAACFQQAIAIAREQQAKLLELRASVRLARCWQQQGQVTEAHQMLAAIYGWFTDGFELADWRAAQALLDELQASALPPVTSLGERE